MIRNCLPPGRGVRVTADEDKPILRLLMLGCACVLMLLGAPLRADNDGGSAGMFLNYGASPRSLGMGKAFAGLADDVEAGYFNPAGLVQLRSQNVKLAHSMLYGGCRMEYIAYGMPSRQSGTFGVALLNYGAEGLDSRNKDNVKFGSWVYAENAFTVSYGYSPWNWLGIGANLKLVTKNMAEFSGVGVGGDLGVIFLGLGPVQIGLSAVNVLKPRMLINSQYETYPMIFRLGTALRTYRDRVLVAFDLDKVGTEFSSRYHARPIRPHGGVEFQIVPDILTSRIGLDVTEVSVGLGLKKLWGNASLGVDYAFLLHHQSNYILGQKHKLGLNIEFAGYRTWVSAMPRVFSPTPDDKQNVLWMDVKVMARRHIKRWQILIKNDLGEVVRSYAGWDSPPLRFAWDGLDDAGRLISDGKYFYEIVLVDDRNETLDNGGPLTTVKTRGPQGRLEIKKKK